MNVLKSISAALAGLLFAITVPAQQLPPLPVDPVIETGKLGCGASYYIVKAPLKKGYASIALVQKGDSLTAQKREGLSTAFLARMGVGPDREGFVKEREGSTIYTFPDVPFYNKDVADSMLLYTFSKMAESRAPQAIVVSGDVEPTVELKKKMSIFSLLVQKLDAPSPAPAYSWNPEQPAVLDFKKESGSAISVTYAGKPVPEVLRNTAQALVTDIFGMEFLVILKHRLEKDLIRAGVTCSSVDERYTVKAQVAPGQEDEALRVMARALATIDAAGAGVQEFKDAKEVLTPGLLRQASVPQDNIGRCIANFLFGANLAPASERVRLFARKNIPEETEARLFNKFASALLSGEKNLTLELAAKDTLDPAEALMVYAANYNNGFAVPSEGDYTWHGADSAGLNFAAPKIRIQKEKADPVSGGTLWTFSNGIKVLFKEVKGSRMFNYSFVLNGGLSQIPGLEEGEGGHIGPMLSLYNVGGIPAPVFRDVLQVNGLSLNAEARLHSLVLSGSAPSGKLAFLLKTLLSLSLERELNKEEFELYAAREALRQPSVEDIIYKELHPGFRYTGRPGAVTPETQDKAEEFFAARFGRMNDGVLIISGDLDPAVVKRLLTRYLGGFSVQKGSTPRRNVDFKTRSGAVTISGTAGPRGIRVALEAPVSVTSDNYYTSLVAAYAMKQALIRELAPYGFTADVTTVPETQPQERFCMGITCFPAGEGDHDVVKALTAVRAAIAKASRRLPAAADVSAWKATVMDRVQLTLSAPEGFTSALEARYAINKDVLSRYQESIQAISPEKVRAFLSAVSSGATVEYIVE